MNRCMKTSNERVYTLSGVLNAPLSWMTIGRMGTLRGDPGIQGPAFQTPRSFCHHGVPSAFEMARASRKTEGLRLVWAWPLLQEGGQWLLCRWVVDCDYKVMLVVCKDLG